MVHTASSSKKSLTLLTQQILKQIIQAWEWVSQTAGAKIEIYKWNLVKLHGTNDNIEKT
jgi:hypothetical protein